MDKTNPHEALSGRPIAKKVLAKMKLHWQRKVVDIKNVIHGRAMADDLQKTVVSQKELAGFDPAHAAYVYTQNQVSVMSEQLMALKEMAPFADIITRAEDLYVPSAPPMSPLTTSYFTCWAFFDACAGPANETIGTTILEVGAAFGMHPELLRLIRLMQDSRMGFYIHHGRDGNVSILEDLVTTAVCRAIVPAGYNGRKNENWYVRLLPPPIPGGTEHVVFTTPYIVIHPDFAEWLAYFRRTFPATAGFDEYDALETLIATGFLLPIRFALISTNGVTQVDARAGNQPFESCLQTLATTLRPQTVQSYRVVQTDFPHLVSLSELCRDPHLLGWFYHLREQHPPLSTGTRQLYLLKLRRLLYEADSEDHSVQPGLIVPADIPARPPRPKQHRPSPPPPHIFQEIFEAPLQNLATTVRPATAQSHRRAVRRFLSFLQTDFPQLFQLSELRRDPHLFAWFRHLCQQNPPLASHTRPQYLFALRRLLSDLASLGHPVQPGLILREDFPPLPITFPERSLQKTINDFSKSSAAPTTYIPMLSCSLVPRECASENVSIWLPTACARWGRTNGLYMFPWASFIPNVSFPSMRTSAR